MAMRWRVLVLFFMVRAVMAFQFGTVGALVPAIGDAFRVDAAAVGLLVGLYLSPGLLFALPGGAIARTFGDRRVVLAGVALMVLGGMVSAISTHWEGQLAGRFLAGTGGVVINVLMSKMITDWFAGREIATAMALSVNSWPAGIGLALLLQPYVAAVGGVPVTFALTAMLAVMAFVALLAGPRQGPAEPVKPGAFPRGAALACVLAAGAIWGLFNAAFSMLFAFGPMLLSGNGWNLAAASSASSIPVWLCAIAVAVGGVMADRLGRANAVMVIGLLLMALGMLALPRSDLVVPALVLIGLASGLPVGAIMSLPARVLTPSTRAAGMGLFFTVFYGCVVAAPSLAGALIDVTGWTGSAMDFGAAALLAAIALLAGFEAIAPEASAAPGTHRMAPCSDTRPIHYIPSRPLRRLAPTVQPTSERQSAYPRRRWAVARTCWSKCAFCHADNSDLASHVAVF